MKKNKLNRLLFVRYRYGEDVYPKTICELIKNLIIKIGIAIFMIFAVSILGSISIYPYLALFKVMEFEIFFVILGFLLNGFYLFVFEQIFHEEVKNFLKKFCKPIKWEE